MIIPLKNNHMINGLDYYERKYKYICDANVRALEITTNDLHFYFMTLISRGDKAGIIILKNLRYLTLRWDGNAAYAVKK